MCGLTLAAGLLHASTVVIKPLADTALFQDDPTNNLGGELTMPIGGAYQIGATGTTTNRGLIKFNVAGQVPAGSTINAVSLLAKVVQVPSPGDGRPTNSVFELRRVLRDWGEGNKRSATTAKNGALASSGEATWNARQFSINSWDTPGGTFGIDWDAVVAGQVFVSGLGAYTFASTPDMVAQVQDWLDKPSSNFGWMIRSQSEQLHYTNRRFASREDTNNAPTLTIDFTPPGGDLRIDSFALSSGRIQLSFTAQPGQPYAIEFTTALGSGVWQTLTNFPVQGAPTVLTGSDSTAAGPARFYRLRSP